MSRALGKAEPAKRERRVAAVPVAYGALTERRSRVEKAAYIVEPPEALEWVGAVCAIGAGGASDR